MKPRIIATALVTAAVGFGLSACGSSDKATSVNASSTSTATAAQGVSGANTPAVVKAANAFLATLTSAQKKTSSSSSATPA